MLAHVKRQELYALASQAAKAAPQKASAEAVRGIHVEADSRRSMLTLTATNYEVAIRASMPATVEQSGSVVVNAKLLPELLSKLPEENVDLEVLNNGRLSIRSGHSQFNLDVLPGERYPMPELPFPDDTLPVEGVCSLANNTTFAVSEDESASPPMKCVRLTIGPDGLKAATSNGFCIMEADGDKKCKGKIQLLLPARSLKILASISKDSDVYEMGLAGKSLVFWSGTLLFSARLVEGKYPDTSTILDRFECEYSVHLDAEELKQAISAVSVVAEKNARIELAFGEHEIVLKAETAYGRSAAPVRGLVLNAPAAPFYYNYKKLLEYLSLAKGKITLEFDRNGILVIRPGSTRYLQSPMRAPNQTAAGTKKAA
jgi:DNA polymerase-3 subunit beta